MDASGENISGVSNQVPLDVQIENALKIQPFQRLAVFFNPREKNSKIIKAKLHTLAKNLDLEIISLRSPPAKNMLEINLDKLIDGSVKVDAVYLPPDSFLISEAKLIGDQLKKAKIMSIGSVEKYIRNGAMVGTVTDYNQLGELAANIVDRHQKGEGLQDIPIQTQQNPKLIINQTTSSILEISLPQELMDNSLVIE